MGSGVIFRTEAQDAFILTNQHIVGSTDVASVRVSNSTEYSGQVVATDGLRDLAVVKICCSTEHSSLRLGQRAAIDQNTSVAVVGFSENTDVQSTSLGLITGVETEPGSNLEIIDTDITLGLLDSGGPLLSMSGEIVGISIVESAPLSGFPVSTETSGFAISATAINAVLNDLISGVSTTVPAATPYPEMVDGTFLPLPWGYKVEVPDGWALEATTPLSITMHDKFSGATIAIYHRGAPSVPGNPYYYYWVDTGFWRQENNYEGEGWQKPLTNLSETVVFTPFSDFETYTDRLLGLRFVGTFEFTGWDFHDTTDVFLERNHLWFVSIYVPQALRDLAEYTEYMQSVDSAADSFNPPFSEVYETWESYKRNL